MGVADRGRKQADGDAWGDAISPERQAELELWLQSWAQEADHGGVEGPFVGLPLTGADVFWLAARELAGTSDPRAVSAAMNRLRPMQYHEITSWVSSSSLHPIMPAGFGGWVLLHGANLAGANLGGANLAGANLGGADLTKAILSEANLAGAHLIQTNLAGAMLDRTNIAGATFFHANLTGVFIERTNFAGADLPGADLAGQTLFKVNLAGANLFKANLAGSKLSEADLSAATLFEANLTGADLTWANLAGTDMRGSHLNAETTLAEATLSTTTLLADVVWNNAPLARIAWETLPTIGDEAVARAHQDKNRKKKDAAVQVTEYEAAARAYRLLAVALRNQGLNEHPDRFAYRAQVMQHVVLRLKRQWGAWLLQTLLAVLAGYGFRLGRIFAAYALIVGLFAAAFLVSGAVTSQMTPTLPQAFDALQISLNAIHGRVFFAQFHLDTVQSWLATAESIIGILIEGVFVAMLVQRFFGGK